MRRIGGSVRFLVLVLATTALACGSGNPGAGDLPISFRDTHVEDPGTAADPGHADAPGRDPGQDLHADPDADRPDEAAVDPGPTDEGDGDPGLQDPGVADPGRDPGTSDPGMVDPGQDATVGCGTGPACAAGSTCINAVCESCRFQFACGLDCVDCQGTATPLCLNGACVRCRVGTDCGAGFWCRPDTHACEQCGDADPAHCGTDCSTCGTTLPVCAAGACTCNSTSCGTLVCFQGACSGCDVDGACGPTCAACPVETPRCVAGACVTCRDPGDCGAGAWCDGGACAPCGPDDPTHCGNACAACTAEAPSCVAGACVCDATSCGIGRRCLDGACQTCDIPEACGAACGACSVATPYCVAGGCRQCRTAGDCAPGAVCSPSGTCIDCTGTLGCASDSAPDGKKCSTAKVLGRKVLVPWFTVSSDTTGKGYDDDLPSGSPPDCWDAQVDVMYKVFLRTGDTLNVTATPLTADYTMSLKLYRGTTCAGNWRADLITCQWGADNGGSETASYTATSAGWVTIVIDGASGFSDEGDWGLFSLTTKLTCADEACCCI
jgi:hypothetical protein